MFFYECAYNAEVLLHFDLEYSESITTPKGDKRPNTYSYIELYQSYIHPRQITLLKEKKF